MAVAMAKLYGSLARVVVFVGFLCDKLYIDAILALHRILAKRHLIHVKATCPYQDDSLPMLTWHKGNTIYSRRDPYQR
eukprot:13779472-Ditylum_brightwellii.AAC.1